MVNVEVEVIKWLTNLAGTGWPVSGDIPAERPTKFITVDRTGGPRESMVLDRAEILIEVYHKDSRMTASDMAQSIADSIHTLKEVENITRAKVNSIVNLDDTMAQYKRYQVYCDIYCRR